MEMSNQQIQKVTYCIFSGLERLDVNVNYFSFYIYSVNIILFHCILHRLTTFTVTGFPIVMGHFYCKSFDQ